MKHLFVRPYPGLIAGLFLFTAFTCPAPVHAQPVETGPLGINGSLIVQGGERLAKCGRRYFRSRSTYGGMARTTSPE